MSWLDNLFYECTFLKKLINNPSFGDYLKNNRLNLHQIEKGYLFLIEVSINRLILAIEYLISDELQEQIMWSWNITTSDFDKQVKKNNKDVQFIKGLESFRKKIQDKRFSKSKKDILPLLKILLVKVKEIEGYYFKTVKFKENKKISKDNMFLFYVANSKPYLNGDLNLISFKIEYYSPVDYSYHLMPPAEKKKYSFLNEDVVNNLSKYIQGYAITLSYIFNKKVDQKLLDRFKSSKSWDEIHQIGCKIRDFIIKKYKIKLFDSVYEIDYQIHSKKIIEKISNLGDLRNLLRDREIMLQNIDYINESSLRHPYDETFPILFNIMLAQICRKEKVDLIELKYKKPNGDFSHSYLIYIFQGGSLGLTNGSYWLLFKDIALSNERWYESNEKLHMDTLLEKFSEQINYHSYVIDPKLFQLYLSKYCRNYAKKIYLENSLKDSNSMLNELLHFYLNVKTCNEKILFSDWGHKFNNNKGEIDSMIVTNSKVIITQSKTNFTNVKEVIKHFKDVLEYLPEYSIKKGFSITNKKIIKQLFFFNEPFLNEDDIIALNKENIQIKIFVEESKKIIDKKQIEKIIRIMGAEYE